MLVSRAFPAAIAACLLATAAMAADSAMPDQQPAIARHHGGGMRGMFTPEQRAMFMLEQRSQTAGMTRDQRKAYRQTEREKLMTMSAADKAKMVGDLQAKWDALPADEKSAALERMKKMQARRVEHNHGGGSDNDDGAQ